MHGKSDEEINRLLIQLKRSLEDVIAVDNKYGNYFYLYRWLIKNQMKTDRTEKTIREAIKWRKANHVDELMNLDWGYWAPGIEKEISININGLTKIGQPLVTVIRDDLNLRALHEKYGRESIMRFQIQSFAKGEKLMMEYFSKIVSTSSIEGEERKSNSDEQRKNEPKFETGYNPSWFWNAPVTICSFKNYSMRNFIHAEDSLEAARIAMNYFPEGASTIYIVNLNKVATKILRILKPIIKTDSHKLEIFDTDKTKWSDILLEQIDTDQLETYFGGSKEDEK